MPLFTNSGSIFSTSNSGFNFQIPSIRQQLELEYAKELEKKGVGDTVWDKVQEGASDFGGIMADVLGKTFDFILRPNFAVAEGTRRALEGSGFDPLDFAKGFSKGIQGDKRTLFSDVLEQEGVLKGHDVWRGIAGFGLDVALDPTTYLTFGAGAAIKTGATGAAKVAPSVLSRSGGLFKTDAGRIAAQNLDDLVYREYAPNQGLFMHQSIKQLEEAGPEFAQRRAYLDWKLRSRKERGKIKKIDELNALEGEGAILERLAMQESKLMDQYMRVGIQVPFMKTWHFTPTHVFGRRISPKAPSLFRMMKKEGVLGNLPLVNQAAKSFAHVFRPDLDDPLHAVKLTARHASEFVESFDIEAMVGLMQKTKNLSDDELLEAVKAVEARKGAVQYGNLQEDIVRATLAKSDVLDPRKLEDYVEGVKGWHEFWQRVYKSEKFFGVTSKGQDFIGVGDKLNGRLYVPRMYTKAGDDVPMSQLRGGLMTEPGFTKARKAEEVTFAELHDLHTAGKLKDEMEFNMRRLAIMRLQKSAYARANAIATRAIKSAWGVPYKVPSKAKLDRTAKNLERLYAGLRDTKADIAGLEQARLLKYHQMDKGVMDEGAFDAWVKNQHFPQITKQRERQRKIEDKIHRLESFMEVKANKVNPIVKEGDYVKVTGISEDFRFPREIAQSVNNFGRILMEDDEMKRAMSIFGRLMHDWKIGVTSINPGYRIRNSLSDMWNAYITPVKEGSMPLWAMAKYSGEAGKTMRRAKVATQKLARGETIKGKELDAFLEVYDMQVRGIISGFYQGDVRALSNLLKYGGTKKTLGKEALEKFPSVIPIIKVFAKTMQDVNRNGENAMRIAHYLYRVRGQNLSKGRASEIVRFTHFDYEDLSPIEQKIFKKVAPFYTWTRKNIPFQLQALALRPGRFSMLPKGIMETSKAAGVEGDILPEFLRESLTAVPIPGTELYLNPQLSSADLERLMNPSEFSSLLGPHIQLPIAAMTGVSLFGQQEIDGGENARLSPINEKVASLLDMVGVDVEQTQRMVNGQEISAPGVNPWVRFAFGFFPLSNVIANQNPIDTAKRGNLGSVPFFGDIAGSDVAYLGGIGVYDPDEESIRIAEEFKAREEIDKIMRRLRDQDIIPESEFEPSPYEQQIGSIIERALSRG